MIQLKEIIGHHQADRVDIFHTFSINCVIIGFQCADSQGFPYSYRYVGWYGHWTVHLVPLLSCDQ